MAERIKSKEVLDNHYQVVVVGAGLSGLVLSQKLKERGINHVVVDSTTKAPSIHYLTSEQAANSLGILGNYHDQKDKRVPITGYYRYDGCSASLEQLESVAPSNNRANGFVTLSLEDLRDCLDAGNIFYGTSVSRVSRETSGWVLETSNGQSTKSELVIDATGARSRVLQMLGDSNLNTEIKRRMVRACYGGVYRYNGPENALLFVENLTQSNTDSPPEGAGWIMPLGDNLAEIVIGWEMPFGEINQWRNGKLKNTLNDYINWFNKRGIQIEPDSRIEPVSGFFSQDLLNPKTIPHQMGIAAFGESLGLNHPLNGYLIRNVAHYAEVMSQQIQRYLESKKWDPHIAQIGSSHINYGQQIALSRKKIEATRNGLGRSAATRDLQALIVSTLGEDGLWHAIDNGLRGSDIFKGLLQNPKHFIAVASLATEYLAVLKEQPAYRTEIFAKLLHNIIN